MPDRRGTETERQRRHRGDGGNGHIDERADDRVGLVEIEGDVVVAALEVSTRAEGSVTAGEDDDAGIGRRLGDGLPEAAERFGIERVEGVGAVDRDGRDTVTVIDEDT